MTNWLQNLQDYRITCSNSISKSFEKKTYGLVPNTVKMPSQELLTDKHDSETVMQLINAYETYFKPQVSRIKTYKHFFAKTRLFKTAQTWYNS